MTTPNVPAPRLLRTAFDGASEVLTLVRLASGDLAVQITTGPNVDDDFVGIYDLDGEPIPYASGLEWEIATDVPANVIEQIETEWATGETVVTRLEGEP